MDAWLSSSPFLAVGIYISGDSRACRSQPNLTADLGRQAARARLAAAADHARPAGLLPTRGSRATATTRRSTPARHHRHLPDRAPPGPRGGRHAVAAAKALGIVAGSTLWYDLEGFDNTT